MKKYSRWPEILVVIAGIIFYLLVFAALALLFIALGSCSTAKPKVVERVITDVRTETVYLHDTLEVLIPAQSSDRVTRDSTSTLETDYALSTAKILSDGSLFHELRNKARKMEIPFLKPVKSKDSIVYLDKEIPVPYEVPVEVVKPLTAWQRFQLRGFWGLLVVVALFLGVRYRTIVFTLFKRAVGLFG